MIVGLGLALGSALGRSVAFLFKHRGAVPAPAVRARHPVQSAVGPFRSLAFYASARGLQHAPGVAVIAFTSVAANLAAIMGGMLVFRDPVGVGPLAIIGRVIAFGLVTAVAAFMPGPLRAGRAPRR